MHQLWISKKSCWQFAARRTNTKALFGFGAHYCGVTIRCFSQVPCTTRFRLLTKGLSGMYLMYHASSAHCFGSWHCVPLPRHRRHSGRSSRHQPPKIAVCHHTSTLFASQPATGTDDQPRATGGATARPPRLRSTACATHNCVTPHAFRLNNMATFS